MATITLVQSIAPSRTKRPAPGASLLLASSTMNRPDKKPRTQQKEPPQPQLSPTMFLRSIFGTADFVNSSPKSFLKPTEEEIEAYDLDTVRAVRSRDIVRLKELYKAGKNLNARNPFGESLLHMACRRGDFPIVSFMLREANVHVDIRDDFGRTPFHDAAWTSEPNYEVMDLLIEVADPLMLLTKDVRGSAPFDYVRRNHWVEWVRFLSERKEMLQEKIRRAQEVPTTSNGGESSQ